jgi:hypothetical protein
MVGGSPQDVLHKQDTPTQGKMQQLFLNEMIGATMLA